MTPFDLSLRHELDLEQRRFGNEWLFRWHNLNIEGKTVDVDRFDGGRITLGGCRFESQQQSIYWQAIGRYLNAKIRSTFRQWEDKTKAYPRGQRQSSLEETNRLLGAFLAGIVKHATETDQAVRFRGHPKADVPQQSGAIYETAKYEILSLTVAHRGLIDDSEESEQSSTTARVANLSPTNGNSSMAGAFDAPAFRSSVRVPFNVPSFRRSPIALMPDELYLELHKLVAEMPELATGPITSEINQWLGRACVLIEQSDSSLEAIKIKVATEHLSGALRSLNVQTIVSIVHRALAKAALMTSASTERRASPASYAATRDVFISHTSEDKDEVARPLVQKLMTEGVTVWFDEFELHLGDSLRRNIERGLRSSRHGLVIMSENFFRKEWPQKELDALFALESQERRLMPIRHRLSAEDISRFAPLMSDRLSVSTDRGLDVVVSNILNALSSDAKRSA